MPEQYALEIKRGIISMYFDVMAQRRTMIGVSFFDIGTLVDVDL